MDYFAGLDVSVKETSVCIVDDTGAFSTARICRVSTQITGKPASARTLYSHCDSGPASGPTRLKR